MPQLITLIVCMVLALGWRTSRMTNIVAQPHSLIPPLMLLFDNNPHLQGCPRCRGAR